jgi:hypothetical protein
MQGVQVTIGKQREHNHDEGILAQRLSGHPRGWLLFRFGDWRRRKVWGEDRMGGAIGRPSWRWSLLGDPGAKFFRQKTRQGGRTQENRGVVTMWTDQRESTGAA